MRLKFSSIETFKESLADKISESVLELTSNLAASMLDEILEFKLCTLVSKLDCTAPISEARLELRLDIWDSNSAS